MVITGLLLLIIAFAAAAAVFGAPLLPPPTDFIVEARQFAYEPGEIHVTKGQLVNIDLRAMDVTHGLYVDGYGVEVKAVPGKPEQLQFVADKAGVFHFRCTQTCGPLHPFMAGKLVVDPNTPFQGSLAGIALLSFAALAVLWLRSPSLASVTGALSSRLSSGSKPAVLKKQLGISFDLLRLPAVKAFLRWRGFQFALMLPFLALLVAAVVAAIRGTPVGSHNLGIVFVWVLWWPLLIILLIPLGGRIWCAACPIPAPGEWLQRLSFIGVRERPSIFGRRRWPSMLRNMWLQNAAFLLIALFSTVILTTPVMTAVVLVAFFIVALLLSAVFSGRTFCRYVCPLGGFIGLCSMASPLALRVKDEDVCRAHKGKECIRGSVAGYGCPWFEYPGTLRRNAYCGLCMECVKTCPKDNIAVGLQRPGSDLLVPATGRNDEAYRTFIALGSAGLYAAVLLGPWGWLKNLAANPLTPAFALYALLLLAISLVAVPALFYLTASLSKRAAGGGVAVGELWRAFSYGLVPLALAAWIAFSISLVLVSARYILPVASDPLGHGWNLLGIGAADGGPVLMNALPYLQAVVLFIGTLWSISTMWGLAQGKLGSARRAGAAVLPMTLFVLASAATFLWLFIG